MALDPTIPTSDFDTDVNYTFMDSKQNGTTDLVSTIAGGVTASVVEAGVGLWNSLPGTEEVETRQLLQRINNDALRVYDENPELIQAAGFIGGSFVPGGLALKGMKLARAGVKGMDWFSKAGKEAEVAGLAKMFAEGAGNTKDYRNAVRGLYAKTAVNQTIDAIAMEAAVIGMMHNTPLMEDYLKDPVQNFGISIALGGVLGTGIGVAADHFIVRSAAGKLTEGALDALRTQVGNVPSNATNAVALQVTGKSLDNITQLLDNGKAAGKTPENDLLMGIAAKTQSIYSKEVDDIFIASVDSKLLENLTVKQKEELKTWMINSPELIGVESVRPIAASDLEGGKLIRGPKSLLGDAPELTKTKTKEGVETIEQIDAVYFPELGLYGTKADVKHYAGANALYGSADEIAKAMKKTFGKYADHDTILSLQTKTSAQAQADYIGAMQLMDNMSIADFKKLKISPTDNAMLTAARAKMAKDPEFAAVGLKLEDATAYNNAVALEKLPVPDNYLFASTENIVKYDLLHKGNQNYDSDSAWSMLTNWKRGSVHDMRLGAEEYKRAGFSATAKRSDPKKQQLYESFKGIYESPESVALREQFSSVADSEGYIYLWRGSRSLKDRAGVRSYTTLRDKAQEFGSPRLYKVHADDVVAGILDPGPAGMKTEILVMEGERIPAQLSSAGKEKLTGNISINSTTADITTLNTLISANKQTEIDSLIANGLPAHTIALKTNTPVEVVEQYSLTRDWSLAKIANTESIQTTDDFANVMNPLKVPLVLKGNNLKHSYAQAMANNNNKMLKDMSAEITAATMYKTQNPFITQLADFLYRPSAEGGQRQLLDLIYDRLGKANNQLAGNFWTASADFAMRNMGDLGPAISYVGKEIQHIGNAAKNAVIEPIRTAMLKMATNAVETVEFNTFREVNAGLTGWRVVKDGKIWQRSIDDAGKALLNEDGTPALTAVKYLGKDYQIVSKNVLDTIDRMQENSKQLLDMMNTTRRIKGMPDVSDIGLWVPSFNPLNKHIAYVHDTLTDTTSIIWANSKEEQQQLIRSYRINLTAQGKDKTTKVYEKGVDQANWSRMNGRMDVMTMTVADSSMKKSGSSAGAIVRSDNQVFAEITAGYEHYITSQFRNMADLAMSDITHELSTMSSLNRFGYESQPFTGVKRATDRPKDAASAMKNLLLGNTNLGEYEGWKSVNQSFETGLSMGVNAVASAWEAATTPLTKTFFGGKKQLTAESMQKMDYEKFANELEKTGIVNPYAAAFDAEAAKMFGMSKLTDSADTSKRLVFASNALAATLALKVGELAQPLVNIMSLPILTGLASANKFPDTFLGISKGTAKVNPVQIMYEGQRAAHDPQFAHLGKLWESKGYFNPMVSEVNDTLKASRSFNKGAIQATERLVDSKFVEIMSKPADWSEAFVRRSTMFTGAMLAKRLYPGLDDLGVTIFARDFMDKAVGNFHAAQRPVLFQGTLGVALGLFQTYSLTLGQNIYRHLELKNYKALGTAMLTQSTLFGIGSMPGFQAVSNMIGEHFSDQHIDLTTGTYRALGDDVAETVLYGLPSLAGIGTHTRGDANFRIPGLSGDNVVAINFAKQAAQAVGTVAGSLGQGNNAGQAFMEALSLQSMSRPLARGAELATGYSITRAGNTVQTPEEVWTTTGIMARVLGTRPTTEVKLREADQLNRFYGAIDREARQSVIKKIKTGIRNSDFDEAKLAEFAEEYFRKGGTPTGWRSAVNTALAQTDTSGKEIFIEHLKPNSPLNYMINSLDGD